MINLGLLLIPQVVGQVLVAKDLIGKTLLDSKDKAAIARMRAHKQKVKESLMG